MHRIDGGQSGTREPEKQRPKRTSCQVKTGHRHHLGQIEKDVYISRSKAQ
jgi:hypothetical protein